LATTVDIAEEMATELDGIDLTNDFLAAANFQGLESHHSCKNYTAFDTLECRLETMVGPTSYGHFNEYEKLFAAHCFELLMGITLREIVWPS